MKSQHNRGAALIEHLEPRVHLSARGRASAVAGVAHTTAVLSAPRWGLAAAALGTKIMFAKGVGPGLHGSDVVDIYDGATGQWSTTTPFPSIGLGAYTAAAVPGKALFSSGPYLTIYDEKTARWFTAKKLPVLIDFGGDGVAVGNQALFPTHDGVMVLYNAGTGRRFLIPTPDLDSWGTAVGSSAVFSTSQGVYVYDTGTGASQAVKLPWGDSAFATAVGTKAIFVNNHALGVYDAVTGRSSVAQPPSNLDLYRAIGASSVGTKAIFAPAVLYDANGQPQLGYAAVYDTATNQWSVAPFTQDRDALIAKSVGKQALFAGGRLGDPGNPGSVALDTVDVYTDLTPTPMLSGGIVPGKKGKIAVTVYNTGDADLSGPSTVKIYACPRRSMRGATLIGTATLQGRLAAGASVRVTILTSLPKNMLPGGYHLVASVAAPGYPETPIASQMQNFIVPVRRTSRFGLASHT